jgi:hypothetical protein
MLDVLSQGSEGMLGREGKAGWLRQAGAGLVSTPANQPHGCTTSPHGGGELLGGFPSLVKEGLGVVVPRRSPTDRQPGLTRSRNLGQGRDEERRLLLCVSARAVSVFPDTASRSAGRVRGTVTICKNGGNKAKKSLKTKEVSIETNPRRASFEFRTSVSNTCFKRLYESPPRRIYSGSGMLPRLV